MMSDAFGLILGLLALFTILPLIVHLPIYVFRYRRMKRIARELGPQFKPTVTLLTLNVWLILALGGLVIAIPNFLRFSAKAPQSEAKTNLGAIFTTQVAYYGENNTYAGRAGENGNGAFYDMGWSPEGDTRYTYYAGGDYIAPTRPGVTMPFKPGKDWPYPIRPESTAHGFTVLAIGNIDKDPCLDVWMMNDAKQLTNLVNDVSDVSSPGMGGQCPGMSTWQRFWSRDIIGGIGKLLLMVLALFGLTSPALIVVVPYMYYLAIKHNRLYQEALAAMAEKEGPHL
jgi:type IV pilus assembly protein PilA